eukprot:TRINITY_DN26435_c0_g1_i1.p1 TRINITY_DN26435_c0_g1~~TRINITY_DN26435_c0_g1_i1.p1  ORF type:complete len:116 (+),score=8.38 TRINITY_DN26435_c0_g1_i1:100-447(+)
MNRNILISSVLLLGLQLVLSSSLDSGYPEGFQQMQDQDKVDLIALPAGDDTKRADFMRNNGIMRSLRSTRPSPMNYLRNTGIMRSTRSVPLDYLRNTGIMRSTRSAQDYYEIQES